MENRLELNKRPVYELPDEVLVGLYCNNYCEPDFKPDICITSFGRLYIKKPKETSKQIWIKADNIDLIEFIRTYNWENKMKKVLLSQAEGDKYSLNIWRFKKIILEEFYGEKYGE